MKLRTKIFIVSTALTLMPFAALAANPNDDGDCAETVIDPYLGTGTRAELYNCKSVGNSGEEQGLYFIADATSASLGYIEDHGTCDVLVKFSGDFGPDPYLDYGTVYNRTMCSDGYVEVWGDNFGPDDPWAATPYVYTIGGEGDQVHNPN